MANKKKPKGEFKLFQETEVLYPFSLLNIMAGVASLL